MADGKKDGAKNSRQFFATCFICIVLVVILLIVCWWQWL